MTILTEKQKCAHGDRDGPADLHRVTSMTSRETKMRKWKMRKWKGVCSHVQNGKADPTARQERSVVAHHGTGQAKPNGQLFVQRLLLAAQEEFMG